MGGGGYGRSRRILAAGAASALMGCYTYTPTPPSAAPPGSDVRIHVARGTPLAVGETPLPQNGNGVVRGKLIEGPSSETLLCSVLLETGLPGSTSRGLRGTVSIPMDAVEELEVRRLDRFRTFSLVGLGTALAFVIVDAAFDVRNSREGTDESGGTDNALITLFRIHP